MGTTLGHCGVEVYALWVEKREKPYIQTDSPSRNMSERQIEADCHAKCTALFELTPTRGFF
jgi:hypothetical protein